MYKYIIILIICLFLALKSSDEPMLSIFSEFEWVTCLLRKFDTGNSIVFNISIGYVVSFIFWLMNVEAPRRKLKSEHKRALISTYNEYREEAVNILIRVHGTYIGESEENFYDPEIREKLLKPEFFRSAFLDNKKNYYAIKNGLDAHDISDIFHEIELFHRELDLFANMFGEESNNDARNHYKNYKNAISRYKYNSVFDENREKYFGEYIIQSLSQSDINFGVLKEDRILSLINKF